MTGVQTCALPICNETGIVLAAGIKHTKTNIPLAGEYVNASANSAKLCIAADGGFQ